MLPPRTLARIAGLLYLLLIAAAAFALSVRSAIVEPDAAAATADNIRASATLFRVSFVVDLVANLVYLLTAMALYLLLRHVHELAAAAMVTFVAVSVAVGSLNLLSHYTALTVATSDVIGSTLLAVAAIGEGAFMVWLVVRGIRLPVAASPRSIPNHDPA